MDEPVLNPDMGLAEELEARKTRSADEPEETGYVTTADIINRHYAAPTYSGRSAFVEPLWSEIVEGLWQGGTDDLDVRQYGNAGPVEITELDFETVITLYQYANPVDWHVREMRYAYGDGPIDQVDMDAVFDVVKFAHERWMKGDRVLIRCQAGWNRSGLITALVMIRAGFDAEEAIRTIRRKRSPHALCNAQFETFLRTTDPELWRADEWTQEEEEFDSLIKGYMGRDPQ